MWDVQRHALEGRYAVLAPDLRGFGGRPHTPGEFSHTDDVLELLDRNGVDRAALVGASFGGRVALETAPALVPADGRPPRPAAAGRLGRAPSVTGRP
jgi:pimeloyl-ACP methyl ester carboxylesterase